MEKKKLLFGLIEMNKTMYNILYTLLCVCVLILIFVFFAAGTAAFINKGLITDLVGYRLVYPAIILISFIGYRILDSKHYA